MTNHRNKQNYRFRTWKFRDRCHLKGGVRQGCFLSLILNYLIQYIHFHSLYIISHYYAKFKENPCVGTDASTPYFNFREFLYYFHTTNKFWNHFNINHHVFVDDADQLGLGARKTVLGN